MPKLYKWIVGFGFVVLISAPLARSLVFFNEPAETPIDNRAAAPMPALVFDFQRVSEFAKHYDLYFSDTFAFRNQLLQIYACLRFVLFRAVPPNTVLGKNRRLFLESDIEIYQNRTLFTPVELERWISTIELRQRRFKSMGIRYILMPVPLSASIYPEDVPDGILPINPIPRRRQFIEAAKSRGLDVLDLEPNLLKEKERHSVFHYADTHWTGWGAHVAFVDLINHLKAQYPTLTTVVPTESLEELVAPLKGDLARTRGLSLLFPEQLLFVVKKGGFSFERHLIPYSDHAPHDSLNYGLMLRNDLRTPRLFVLSDSFGLYILDFLGEAFSRVYYGPKDKIDWDLVKEQNPDVVLQIFVERRFYESNGTFLNGI